MTPTDEELMADFFETTEYVDEGVPPWESEPATGLTPDEPGGEDLPDAEDDEEDEELDLSDSFDLCGGKGGKAGPCPGHDKRVRSVWNDPEKKREHRVRLRGRTLEARSALLTVEHATKDGYPARTAANVKAADVTIAFAQDFNSPGERLTRRLAGEKYVPVDMSLAPDEAAEVLVDRLTKLKLTGPVAVNIAGNALPTLKMSQDDADAWVEDVLSRVAVRDDVPFRITAGRSGGQSGIDEAGAKALLELGVPTTVLMPKDGAVRIARGKDVRESKQSTRERILKIQGDAFDRGVKRNLTDEFSDAEVDQLFFELCGGKGGTAGPCPGQRTGKSWARMRHSKNSVATPPGFDPLDFSSDEAEAAQEALEGWLQPRVPEGTRAATKVFVAQVLGQKLGAAHDTETLRRVSDELLSHGLEQRRGSQGPSDIAEDVASQLVRSWAVSSSDGRVVSLGIQEAARALAPDADKIESEREAIGAKLEHDEAPLSAEAKAVIQTFVQATYDQTQEVLRQAEITEVTLYRGGATMTQDYRSGLATIGTRPLTSFTTDFQVATKYADNRSAQLLEYDEIDDVEHPTMWVSVIRVPASRVFSTFATGSGCHNESEIVLLGGKDKVFMRTLEGLSREEYDDGDDVADGTTDEAIERFYEEDVFMARARSRVEKVRAKAAAHG